MCLYLLLSEDNKHEALLLLLYFGMTDMKLYDGMTDMRLDAGTKASAC